MAKHRLPPAAFPKAKTNKAMDPASGPATPGEGRVRLEVHQKFAESTEARTRATKVREPERRTGPIHSTPAAAAGIQNAQEKTQASAKNQMRG